MGQTNSKRRRFFQGLLKISNFCLHLFQNVSPDDTHSYVQAGGGKTGVYWRYYVTNHNASAIFYLNHHDNYFNKECFQYLESFKTKINNDFGGSLDWNFKEGRKCQYIQSICQIGGLEDDNDWPEIFGDLVDRMVRLEQALRYYINKLP